MALAIIQLIGTICSLWQDAERDRYISENKNLEAQYHDELTKPIPDDSAKYMADPSSYRNNAAIDNIEFQLRNLSLALSAAVAAKNSGNQSQTG